MEGLLCLQMHAVCAVILSLLLFWTGRTGILSAADRWLKGSLVAFLVHTLAHGALWAGALLPSSGVLIVSVPWLELLWTAAMDIGAFFWCGYAESIRHQRTYEKGSAVRRTAEMILAGLLGLALADTLLVCYGPGRSPLLFYGHMALLLAGTLLHAARLVRSSLRESDPQQQAHDILTALFPLCLAAVWLSDAFQVRLPFACSLLMLNMLCMDRGSTLKQISMDALTQVNNRHNLMEFIRYRIGHHDQELFLFMIDVDDFKKINDTLGHPEGDRALVAVAAFLKAVCAQVRLRPYIARYGGDEFIVIMEGTEEEALAVYGRLSAGVPETSREGPGCPVRISAGMVRYTPGTDAREWIASADQKLYRQKKHHKR